MFIEDTAMVEDTYGDDGDDPEVRDDGAETTR